MIRTILSLNVMAGCMYANGLPVLWSSCILITFDHVDACSYFYLWFDDQLEATRRCLIFLRSENGEIFIEDRNSAVSLIFLETYCRYNILFYCI